MVTCIYRLIIQDDKTSGLVLTGYVEHKGGEQQPQARGQHLQQSHNNQLRPRSITHNNACNNSI